MRSSIVLVVLACVTATGCGGNGPTAPPAARGPVDEGVQGTRSDGVTGASGSGSAPEDDDGFIVGSWRHVVGSCSYTYRFTRAGRFELTATAGEAIDGYYALAKVGSGSERWALTLDIESDDGGEDCEGHRIDESGRTYVLAVDPIGTSALDVYRTATSTSKDARWMRVN